MKVKILRNGKVCDMPTQNAEAYISTGQAVAVDASGNEIKAMAEPVADKQIRKPAGKKSVFACLKCGKEYKTERGLKNHKC